MKHGVEWGSDSPPGRASRPRRPVPRIGGMGGRTKAPARGRDKEKPPRRNRVGTKQADTWGSACDRAAAPVLGFSAGMPFILCSPLAVITAITWITRVRPNCKLIPMGIHMGGGSPVEANSAPRWGQMVADVRTRRKIRPQEGAGDCRAPLSQKRGRGGPRGRDQWEHTPAVDQGA